MIQVSTVANNQSFGVFLSRVNQIAALMSSNVVTVDWTSAGSLSTGNAQVNGFLQANQVTVYQKIRGGTNPVPGTLWVGANVEFTNDSNSRIVWITANASTTATQINTATLTVTGNTSVTASNVSFTGVANMVISGGVVNLTSSVNGSNTARFSALGVKVAPTSDLHVDSGNASFLPTVALSSNNGVKTIVGDANGVFTGMTAGQLAIKATGGALGLGVGTVWGLYVNSTSLQVNTSLTVAMGSNVTIGVYRNEGSFKFTTSGTGAQIVDSFPFSAWRSAEYAVQMEDDVTSRYQLSKVLLVHNGANTFTTEYAVVQSNGAMATLTSNIAGANVNLIVTPLVSGTRVTYSRTMIADT